MLAGTQHRRRGGGEGQDTGFCKGGRTQYTEWSLEIVRIPDNNCPAVAASVCCFPHEPALPNVGIAAKGDT